MKVSAVEQSGGPRKSSRLRNRTLYHPERRHFTPLQHFNTPTTITTNLHRTDYNCILITYKHEQQEYLITNQLVLSSSKMCSYPETKLGTASSRSLMQTSAGIKQSRPYLPLDAQQCSTTFKTRSRLSERNGNIWKVYDSSYLAAPQQGQSIQAWIFVIPVGCPNDMPCVDAFVALDQIVGTSIQQHDDWMVGKMRMSLAVLGSVMSIDAPSGISTWGRGSCWWKPVISLSLSLKKLRGC